MVISPRRGIERSADSARSGHGRGIPRGRLRHHPIETALNQGLARQPGCSPRTKVRRTAATFAKLPELCARTGQAPHPTPAGKHSALNTELPLNEYSVRRSAKHLRGRRRQQPDRQSRSSDRFPVLLTVICFWRNLSKPLIPLGDCPVCALIASLFSLEKSPCFQKNTPLPKAYV